MNETDATSIEDAAVEEALDSLVRLRSFEALEQWLRAHGPRQRAAVLRTLLRKRSQRHGGLVYAPWLDLLCEVESDPRAAWEKREAARLATERFAKEAESEMDFVVEPLDRGDVKEMIARCDELIARARAVRAGGQVGFLQKLRADALQILEAGSRADNLEEAIEALNEALSYAPPGVPALETMLDLARVYTEREVGDRVDNLAISSNMVEVALDLTTEDDPLEQRGLLKYEFAKSLMRREDGDRRANLARDPLCRRGDG